MLERINETYLGLVEGNEPMQRSPDYYIRKLHEETDETHEHIVYPNPEEYLKEQADVFICWLGLNEAMGVSIEVALEAVQLKLEDLIVRAGYASAHEDFWTGWELAKGK